MNHRRAMLPLMCIAAACALALGGCERRQEPVQRPSAVPSTATWAGGSDGGVYINCSTGDREWNNCTVWNDGDGSVWYTGRFVLEGQNRPANSSELQYSSADGTRILLANHLVLRPLR